MDAPPAIQQQCSDEFLERLQVDEVTIKLYQTQDDLNRKVRSEYADLQQKYYILLYLYGELKDQESPESPGV